MSEHTRYTPPKKVRALKPVPATQPPPSPSAGSSSGSSSNDTFGMKALVVTSLVSSLVSSVITFVVTKALEVKYEEEKVKAKNPPSGELPRDDLGKTMIAAIRGGRYEPS